MKSLYFSYDTEVDKAYIIKIDGNEHSETLANRCAESCKRVGMPFEFWSAYDGLRDKIKVPNHLVDNLVMKLLKVTNHYLTRGEVACALSHISLWVRCIEIDKPIVILEHDAVMVKAYVRQTVYNSICYLGCAEQQYGMSPILSTPPHATEGPNYHFLCRAHAYAIDPQIAKNMLAHVIKYGICESLDLIVRSDIFPIHQTGLYAYDVVDPDINQNTTIKGRPLEGRSTIRNDGLDV